MNGSGFSESKPGYPVFLFSRLCGLKMDKYSQKIINFGRIFTKLINFSRKTNLIILINNFKYTGHEACQTDESGKFLIVEVYLGIH